MVLPLRFQGANRLRYLFSVLGAAALAALLGYGLAALSRDQPAEAVNAVAAVAPPQAEEKAGSQTAGEITKPHDDFDSKARTTAKEVQATPALVEPQVSAPTPTQPQTQKTSSSHGVSIDPMPRQITEKALPIATLATRPLKSIVKVASATRAPPKPAAKSLGAEPSPILSPATAATAARLALKLTLAAVKDSTPEATTNSRTEKAVSDPNPASQAEAGKTLQSIHISNQGGATRILLATSASSEALGLRELPSEHAYIVDFPGEWAVGPGVAKSLQPSDSKLRRLEVKHVASFLRLVLYCAPAAINRPIVKADGQGFTITIQ